MVGKTLIFFREHSQWISVFAYKIAFFSKLFLWYAKKPRFYRKMNNNLETSSSPVLILADFADGSWHATSFAIQHLHRPDSLLSILHTYENPGWGHFTMRKLSHSLKKIAKYELKQLKNKLLTNFSIKKTEVETLVMEGDLNSILQYKPLIKGEYYITLGIYSSFPDSCNRQNKCLEELINTTHHPLFILPGDFDKQANKKISFVGNPNKIPSTPLVKKVLEICKESQSALEILFVLSNGVQKVPDEILNFYDKNFESINYDIKQLRGTTKCKGIKDHIGEKNKDLLIIENS